MSRWSKNDCSVTTADGGGPASYKWIRDVAGRELPRWSLQRSWKPTDVAHFAWIRMRAEGAIDWSSEAQVRIAAARAIQRVLVDRAKYWRAQKRGGRRPEPLPTDAVFDRVDSGLILELEDLLSLMSRRNPVAAECVRLRAFGGYDYAEISELLRCSKSTVERAVSWARHWLRARGANDGFSGDF